MPIDNAAIDPQSYTTFGALLRYLRRRARMTQRDLGIAVGYSEGHINRFEKNKNCPDPSAVASLFIPALDLMNESPLAARLIELASSTLTSSTSHPELLEPIPFAPLHEITRAQMLAQVRTRLREERHLVLCGQPGIGKTTLASALAREYCQTMPVFWLTLTEGVTTSVDVWVYRLAQFLLTLGQTQVKPLVAAGGGTRNKIRFDQQMALLASALVKHPALLVFDNAEVVRREEMCLQLLRHLSATTSALVLLTTRESLPLARFTEMTIEGFESGEGLAFIAQSLGHAFDEKQALRLIDKVGGSPMLLRLALGQLGDHSINAETFILHLETQPQVASYLLQTLQAQSSSQAWRLLLLLAVFQQPLNLFDAYLIELVETLGGIQDMGEAIGELQRRRLIGDAASARLHPFVREYVYRTLSAQVNLRQRLHRLAGDWLKETSQDVVAAAMHYSRAGLPDQTLDRIEENQDTIIARGQASAAVAILDEVHAPIKRLCPRQNDLLRRWLTTRGILLEGTLRATEGEGNLREAILLADNPAVRANIAYGLAEMTQQRSDFQETLRLVQTARAQLAPDDLLLRARLVSLECVAHEMLGNFEETVHTANEALALADQLVGMPLSLTGEIRARVQIELADVARQRRDLAAAMSHAQSALASARAAHSPRRVALCLHFVGGLYCDLGDLDASFRYRSEALDGLLAIGDIHSAAYVLSNLSDIHYLRLEPNQALEKLERACETLRILNDMRGLASAESERTSCLLWLGRVQEARSVIEQLLKEAEGKGTERLWAYRLNKLAIVQLVQGETDEAIDTLRHAHNLPATSTHRMMHFDLHTTLALALTVGGDTEAALRELADAPRFEGQSRWSEFDRDLIEGYVDLAGGNVMTARQHADQVLQRAGEYPVYRQSANQLMSAIQQSAPASAFPRLLWVKCE